MKTKFILSLAAIGLALVALADSPTYTTKASGAGTGTAAVPAFVIFPARPQTQIRVVSVAWKSDTNNATLKFSGGATAFNTTLTNAATSSITNMINSTNGLSGSAVIVLQHAGVCYQTTVASWNSNAGVTNVVTASGGFASYSSVGDSVYVLDTITTLDASTVISDKEGEALYVAALPDRPVLITLSPAWVTNQITSATVHYD
jgi:hypothetical protein